MKKKGYLLLIVICILLLWGARKPIFDIGCMLIYGRKEHVSPVKTNDKLSKLIVKEFDGILTYYGREKRKNSEVHYEFKLNAYDPELIEKIVKVVNEYIIGNDCGEVSFSCYSQMTAPGPLAFGFMNYGMDGIGIGEYRVYKDEETWNN